MSRFSPELNKRLNHATGSVGLVVLLGLVAGALFTAMPDCTAGRGFDLFLYAVIIFSLLSFGVLPLLFLFLAALPGYFGGKPAIYVEVALLIVASLGLAIYSAQPHPDSLYSYHCLAKSSSF
jgi:hypothetical protein